MLPQVLFAVAGVEQHPGDRAGALVLVEDAHLVVHQVDVAEVRVLAHDRQAQGVVERVHGAVALAVAMMRSPPTWTLTVASVTTSPSSRFSTITRKLSRRNSGSCGAELLAQEQVERGVGGLVVVALVLLLLEALQDGRRRARRRRRARSPARAPCAARRPCPTARRSARAARCRRAAGVDVLEGLRRAASIAATCRPPLWAKALRPT